MNDSVQMGLMLRYKGHSAIIDSKIKEFLLDKNR
jgi:hypothetical protein